MDGVIDISAARALVSDAALWPRVRDFLWDFASQIHPTWLEGLSAGPGDRWFQETVKQSNDQTVKRFPSRVSRWILSELSVEPCFHPFPAGDFSRLLLLDSGTLVAIARWLGALASATALRRVTRGPDVAALKAALPGVYPEVLSFAPYFAKSGLPDLSPETSPDAVQSLGFSLLHDALSGLPPPLLRRLALKLPASAHLPTIKRSNDQTVKRSNGQTIERSNGQTIKLLLKLRFPEAFALCCS